MKDGLLVVSGLAASGLAFLGATAIFGGGVGLVVTAVVIVGFLVADTLSTNEHNKKIAEHNKQVAEDRRRMYDVMVRNGIKVEYGGDKAWKEGCRIDPETNAVIEPGA